MTSFSFKSIVTMFFIEIKRWIGDDEAQGARKDKGIRTRHREQGGALQLELCAAK